MEDKPPSQFQSLEYRYSDCERNYAMSSRTFDPADFKAVGALAVDQLLTAVRDDPEHVLSRLCEKLDSLRAERVRELVGIRVIRPLYTC